LPDDDDALLLICNSFGSAPACGAQFLPLGPGTTRDGPSLDPAHSRALWRALVDAAGVAASTQVSVINARTFRFDGTTLAFYFFNADVSPPPRSTPVPPP